MRIKIILKWNGTTVLNGRASAVMAWDILQAYAGNFVNRDKAGWTCPTLIDLNNASPGEVFAGVASDGSGTASYRLEVE